MMVVSMGFLEVRVGGGCQSGFLEARIGSDDDSTAIVVIVAIAGDGGSQSGVP